MVVLRVCLCFLFSFVFLALYPFPSMASEVIQEGYSLGYSDGFVEFGSNGISTPTDSLSVSDLTVFADILNIMSVPGNNDYPSDSPFDGGLYIEADTSSLGDVLIYIPPVYQFGYLSFNLSDNIVNVTNTSITGFMFVGSTQYNFRISAWSTPEYRLYGTSNSYQSLNVIGILNTNVVFLDSVSDLPPVPRSELYQLVQIFLLGVIALCLFIKRL